jgi:hypothetical protein
MNLEHIFNMVVKNCTSIVSNNRIVTINGKIVSIPEDAKVINITVEGNCERVSGDNTQVTVKGDVGEYVRTTNGDIDIGQGVGGHVETTNGDISIHGKVNGYVSTVNGDITK